MAQQLTDPALDSSQDLSLPSPNEPLDFSNLNPLMGAANNHTIMATSGGTFASGFYDGVTKGVAATLVSSGVSLANSAVSIGNLFGLGAEEIKTRNVLLGLDDNLANYYDAHKEGVDLGGEVLSALAPGLGGIKLLKMAQGAGKAGNNFLRATNVFKSIQDDALKIAESKIATGTLADAYSGQRIKAILAGAGDQALQAIAFESAVSVTMDLAPALNKDSIDVLGGITGFAKNVGIASLLGGAIGGIFEAASVRGQLNRFLRLESKNIRPFEVTDDIGKLNIDSGTRVSQMFWQMDRKMKLFDTGVPLTEKEFNTLSKTTKTLDTNIRLEMQNLTGGDAALANKLYDGLKTLDPDDFASALTASSRVGRVADLNFDPAAAHLPVWDRPLKPKKNQLIYDLSETSTRGEVLLDNIVPSVADFASKGRISRLSDGSIFTGSGKALTLSSKELGEMTPLEASVNWTSYALDTKKMVDDVLLDGRNLPQMQRALLDKPTEFTTINTGGVRLETLEDVALYVRNKKEDLVEKLLRDERSVDEIARIADVDKNFIEDTSKGNWMLYGTTDYTAPQYAVATFNHDAVPSAFQMEGIVATQQQIQIARQNAYAVTASYFKDSVNQLPKMIVDTATPVDRASGFFTSSQGFYGTIQAAAEQVGRFLTQKIYKDHQANLDLLFSARRDIQNDPKLMAEFNAVVGRLRGSSEKFTFDTTGLVYGANTIVSRSYMQDVEKALLKASKGGDISNLPAAGDILAGVPSPAKDQVINLPKEIADYLRLHVQVNDSRVGSFKNMINARGQTSSLSSGTVYVPPIDTTRQNFVAFVKMPEGKFGGTSEKAAIVAPNAETLQKKIDMIQAKFGNQFEVYTDSDVKKYYKVKGEYDSQLMFNEPAINSALAREGILSDVIPRTDSYVFDEFDRWHFRQEQGLARGMAELHYGQEFAELHALGEQYSNIITSRGINASAKNVKNPYEDIIKTSLGISRLPENQLWSRLNEFAETTATKAFNTVQEVFQKASNGGISWSDANTAMEKYGYKAPFSDLYSLQTANTKIPQPVLQPFIQKMNAVLATAVLRLDFLDTAMNVLSSPILIGAEVSNIRRSLKDPEIVGELNKLMGVQIPGGSAEQLIPSTPKLYGMAIKDYWDGLMKRNNMMDRYKSYGFIKNENDLYKELIDTATLKGNETASTLVALGNKAVDLGVKLTGNDWSQGFTRFVAANIMERIALTAKLPEAERVAYMNTFVNRVMGNMTGSQRPVLFQGAIGNAVGLFQTYQFNMAQNVFRYLETGDKKAVGMLLGLQNSLYGLQSNPAFYAINTQLVGRNTPGHEDIISGTYKVVGKTTGDWIMYGIGANALQTNIYSRGDLTPRFASVIPTTIGDIPIVNATARFASAIFDTAKQLTETGNKGEILLQGLAHMSVNRPLAGIAQVASGVVTTMAAGNLISSSNDTFSLASASRIAGGKPLDEAIKTDAMYRRNVYKSMDNDRLETIGAALKTKLRGDGSDMTTEDWKDVTTRYTSAGGRIENFSGWVHRQMLSANTSVVNKAAKQISDPTVKNMMAVMGGEIPDFLNTPPAIARTPTDVPVQ